MFGVNRLDSCSSKTTEGSCNSCVPPLTQYKLMNTDTVCGDGGALKSGTHALVMKESVEDCDLKCQSEKGCVWF